MTTDTESKLQQRVTDLEGRVASLEGRLQLALMEVGALSAKASRAASPVEQNPAGDQEVELAAKQAEREMYATE